MLKFFMGKAKFQVFFQKLYNFALLGLNYSAASRYADNGERYVLQLLERNIEKEDSVVLFDVGANVGKYSRAVLEIFAGKNIKIFAFEPSLPTFEALKTNVGEAKNVCFVNKGISDEDKELMLYTNEAKSGLSSVYQRDLEHVKIDFSVEELIKVTTIGGFCSKNNIDVIDYLKLDIEGHEIAGLEGAKEMLDNGKIRMIQFEFGGCNIDSRTFFKDFYTLLNKNYHLFRIVRDGLVPLPTYSEKLEVFQSCNYLAVSRHDNRLSF